MSSTEQPVFSTSGDTPLTSDKEKVEENNDTISDSDMDEEMENLEASEENLSSDDDEEEGEPTGEVMWQIVRDDDDEPSGELVGNPDESSDDDSEQGEQFQSEEDEEEPPHASVSKPTLQPDSVHKSTVESMEIDENEEDSDYSDLALEHGLPPKLVIPVTYDTIQTTFEYFPNTSTKRKKPKNLPSSTPKSPAFSNQVFPSPLRNIPPVPWPPTTQPDTAYPEPPREPARFPPKTVRRVMTFLTCTEDIRVSHPAVDAVSIALECFVRQFTKEAYQYAQKKNRNVLRYDDLAYIGNHYANLYFLQDYLPPQEAAGYVVRKVLEESGVGFPTEGGEVSEAKKLKFEINAKKAERGKRDFDNPVVATATDMAGMWDADPKLKKWRHMNRHSGKGKGSKA